MSCNCDFYGSHNCVTCNPSHPTNVMKRNALEINSLKQQLAEEKQALAERDVDIKRLREALEFYEREDNYRMRFPTPFSFISPARCFEPYVPIERDKGDKAREALATPSAGEGG